MNLSATSDLVAFGPHLTLPGRSIQLERNAEVFGEGEPADFLYLVVSGAVRGVRFSSDGRRQILAFHRAGEMFGLETGAAYACTAEAVNGVELLQMRRSVLEKAAATDVLAARSWLDFTAGRLKQAQDHAIILGRKSASERVAAFLVAFSAHGAEMDLPMSRSDIADYLGLTIETVSRCFSDMERRRVIDLPTSRHVVVRSRTTLAQLEAA